MSTSDDVAEAEANFKGPGPLLRPQRQPPPPPTEIQRPQSSFEVEEQSSPSVPDAELPPARPTLLSEFTDLFDHFDYGAVRKRIVDRSLKECPFGTILWRIFLHCLPTDTTKWSPALAESRAEYDKLAHQFVIDPHKLSQKTKIDQNDDHPLSQSEDSSWLRYHQNNELRDNLEQDVRRTYPEYLFFHQANIQELIIKILFIHSLKHENKLPYRQGMHEILAVVIFCIYTEGVRVNEDPESNELMRNVYDPQYIEHDAFSIYENLMQHLKQFYDVKGENAAKKKFVTTGKVKDYIVQAIDTASRVNNIVKRLHEFNGPLDEKLRNIGIDPSIYGIRWLRLLFGREIAFESIPSLWTLIFCFDDQFGFVDFFFLALLIERGQYLGDQRNPLCFSTSVQALLPNDVVVDTEDLIVKALAMAEQSSTLASPFSHRPVSTESNPFDSAQESDARAKGSSRVPAFPPRFVTNDTSKPPSSRSARSKIICDAELEQFPGTKERARLDEYIQMQTICAHYIAELVHKLEQDLKKNAIEDDAALRDTINGFEHITDALKGRTALDEKKLSNALGSTDEETPQPEKDFS